MRTIMQHHREIIVGRKATRTLKNMNNMLQHGQKWGVLRYMREGNRAYTKFIVAYEPQFTRVVDLGIERVMRGWK